MSRPAAAAVAVDDIIRHLLDLVVHARRYHRWPGKPPQMMQLGEGEIRSLYAAAKDVFLRQPNLLDLDAPINICGELHGQYRDLLRIFDGITGFPLQPAGPAGSGSSNSNCNNNKYLFLGDYYVDRGEQILEPICLLLAYKVRYPEQLFLFRGNHECASINRIYGFYDECKRRYSVRLWRTFSDCFNCLPVAAVVDGRILCVHGGLSPHLRSLDQIRHLPRPCDVPDEGLLCDLLWSDPAAGWATGWAPNHDRGVSCTFGADVLVDFLRRHDLDLVCRAHQVVEDGYEFFADRQLVTVFSAPNYCGEFDNAGAVMTVDADLVCSFRVIKPADNDSKGNSRSRRRGISFISSSALLLGMGSSAAAATAMPSNKNNKSSNSRRTSSKGFI